MERNIIPIIIILLLIGGLYYVQWQKKQQTEMRAFTAEFERYKEQKLKEMEEKIASPEQRMAEYLRQGWRQLDQGQYRAALNTARRILLIDPESEEAKSIESVAMSALNRRNVSKDVLQDSGSDYSNY